MSQKSTHSKELAAADSSAKANLFFYLIVLPLLAIGTAFLWSSFFSLTVEVGSAGDVIANGFDTIQSIFRVLGMIMGSIIILSAISLRREGAHINAYWSAVVGTMLASFCYYV